MTAMSLIGPGMILFGLHQRSRARASERWPRVSGTVAKAGLSKDGDGDVVDVAVEYDYAMNGVSYVGKRLRFGGWYWKQNLIQAELDRYRPGTAVSVFVNPSDPSDAVLRPEAPGSRWWILLGILAILMSLAAILSTIYGNPDAAMPN
jgi:hypothetical protein